MSERYNKVFSLVDNLYSPNVPIILMAGALYVDQKNGSMIAQVKFKNISEKVVKAIRVVFIQKDSFNRIIDEKVEYVYKNCNAKPYTTFGDREAVVLNSEACSFSVEIKELLLEGEDTLEYEKGIFDPIPKQELLSNVLSENSLRAYQNIFNSNMKYVPIQYQNLILCGCGNVYRDEIDKCPFCNQTFEHLISRIDNEQLDLEYRYKVSLDKFMESKTKEQYLLCANLFKELGDFEEAESYYHQCMDKYEAMLNKSKKNKKIAFRLVLAALVILCITFVSLNVYKSNMHNKEIYKYAIEQYEQGFELEALNAYKRIGNYKDSQKKMNEIEENMYVEASSLMEINDYDEAASKFSYIIDYKDSKELCKKCYFEYIDTLVEKKLYASAKLKINCIQEEEIKNALVEKYKGILY